jgi:hypothetical protein
LVDTVHLECPPGENFEVQEDARNVIAIASQISQSASARGHGNSQFHVLNTYGGKGPWAISCVLRDLYIYIYLDFRVDSPTQEIISIGFTLGRLCLGLTLTVLSQ